MDLHVIGTDSDRGVFDALADISHSQSLGLSLSWQAVTKTSDKTCIHQATTYPLVLAIIKGLPTLLHYQTHAQADKVSLAKITPNWQALTRRIVSAGRKSELILQACKLGTGDRAIDATAGFGHDGLILASTGASVTLIEQNPVMALLLWFEKEIMNQNKNWQKLLSRITICFGNSTDVLPNLDKADLIYLDPMFPTGSYQAQVGKHMQLLHVLADAPTPSQERELMNCAKDSLTNTGKIIVKRPNAPTTPAPYFAGLAPSHSVANEAIRFDVYL